MLLANHGALTVGGDLFGAYYKMETIEHFAKISLVARLLGRENLIAREEVERLQELRGTYGIKAPAPLCPEPSTTTPVAVGRGAGEGEMCQTVQSPPSGTGMRLVPDVIGAARGNGAGGQALRHLHGEADEDADIRLTYRELSALIEDAIRSLR
jgi:L-fuculose-phosphate aldolase